MAKTLTLPENTKGRDFIIGDIHGMFPEVELALKKAAFDPTKDRLICVGDLIDRGPESHRALEYLQKSWFYSALGNHEVMFLATVKDGVINQERFANNVKHGMGWIAHLDAAQLRAFEKAFRNMPLAIEIENPEGKIGILHAEVPAGMAWDDMMANIAADDRDTKVSIIWSRKRLDEGDHSGVPGISRVFSGHSPQLHGLTKRGNCFYIDTGGIFGDPAQQDGLFLTMVEARASERQLTSRPQPDANKVSVIQAAPPPGRAPAPRMAPPRPF